MAGESARRAPGPTVAKAGVRLDGRYLLIARHPTRQSSWSARDDLLGRPVELRPIVPGVDPALLLTEAPTDARWLRLFDVVADGDAHWLVLESPPAPTLTQRLADGPLDPAEATALGIAVAHALAELPPHVRPAMLGPDEVLVDGSNVRLDGTAAVCDGTPTGLDDTAAVRCVGALIFAALAARWPLPGPCGLAAAPAGIGPRKFRGGVPRAMDTIVMRALTAQPATPGALAAALEALPRPRTSAERSDHRSRAAAKRWTTRLAPPVAIALLGLLAWTLGKDLGAVPGADRSSGRVVALPTPGVSDQERVWTTPPHVFVLGTGAASGVPRRAVDTDPRSSWPVGDTGAALGLDLGRSRLVTAVQLALTDGGAVVEIRAGDQRPTSVTSLPVILHRRLPRAAMTVRLPSPGNARYWVVRLVALPPHIPVPEALASLALLGPDGR